MSQFKLRPWLALGFVLLTGALTARGVALRMHGGGPSETVALDFHLHEEAAARGIHFAHEGYENSQIPNVAPWIQSFGASVAVADVNGDGFMDFYVVRNRLGSNNELYLNDGHGHFVESAERLGLARLNLQDISVRPLIFDCDGDGRKDLFLTSAHCPRVFRQKADGTFANVEQPLQYGGCFIAEAAAFNDFNGDGTLDVAIGGINGDGGAGFRTLPTNFVDARNGSELDVLVNDGACHFRADKDLLKPNGKFFYHSIGLGDLRGTGRADVWVATDFNSDKVFLNDKKGFEFRAMEGTNSRFGMNSNLCIWKAQTHLMFCQSLVPARLCTRRKHILALWKWRPQGRGH